MASHYPKEGRKCWISCWNRYTHWYYEWNPSYYVWNQRVFMWNLWYDRLSHGITCHLMLSSYQILHLEIQLHVLSSGIMYKAKSTCIFSKTVEPTNQNQIKSCHFYMKKMWKLGKQQFRTPKHPHVLLKAEAHVSRRKVKQIKHKLSF